MIPLRRAKRQFSTQIIKLKAKSSMGLQDPTRLPYSWGSAAALIHWLGWSHAWPVPGLSVTRHHNAYSKDLSPQSVQMTRSHTRSMTTEVSVVCLSSSLYEQGS